MTAVLLDGCWCYNKLVGYAFVRSRERSSELSAEKVATILKVLLLLCHYG